MRLQRLDFRTVTILSLALPVLAEGLLCGGCGVGGTTGPIFEDLAAPEAYRLVQGNAGNDNFVILDVRTPAEFAAGHIENAVNLDYNSGAFAAALPGLAKDRIYFIYCGSGHRSSLAMDMMEQQRFTEVHNLAGGLPTWQAQGYPIVE